MKKKYYPSATQFAQETQTGMPTRDPQVSPSVAILTGGFDRPYAFGLCMALLANNVQLEVIGSDDVDSPEMHASSRLTFLNFQAGWKANVSVINKVLRVLAFYVRLIRYAATSGAPVFHILWNNKVPLFDRTVLMLFYKALNKKIVFTAHNVNAATRDGVDSPLNRITLKMQYNLADHIFVHTQAMKAELIRDFKVMESAVTVIPFGINNAVPNTSLTSAAAKDRLGLVKGERTILFFGAIRPYKGLEDLVAAFQLLGEDSGVYRLIVAGEPKRESAGYVHQIVEALNAEPHGRRIIQCLEFIPDSETEVYFKAADVLVLPYKSIFQSGVLLLSYSFGLPVIATDIGSFREDITEGETGFICMPNSPADLARAIQTYFESPLFHNLERRRREIMVDAASRNSWETVGDKTCSVYAALLADT